MQVRVAVLFSQRLGLTAASRRAKAAEPHSTAAAPRRRFARAAYRDHKHEVRASDSPANRSSVFERREGTAVIRRSCSEIRDQNRKIDLGCRRGHAKVLMILTSETRLANSSSRRSRCGVRLRRSAPIAAAQRPSDDSEDSLGKQRGTTRVGAAWCSCPTSFTREQARGGLGGSWRSGSVVHHVQVRVSVLFSQRLGLTGASRGAKRRSRTPQRLRREDVSPEPPIATTSTKCERVTAPPSVPASLSDGRELR